MIAFLIGGSLTALFLWAILTPTRQERATQLALDKILAATPSSRGQKLNRAGVAAIPVVTSSVIPEPPPPPGGRHPREVFVCTCTYRGRNDGLPRL